MGNSIAFDTLAYAKKLISAGVPEKQAEVQAEALSEIVDERLASKADIRDLKRESKEDIGVYSGLKINFVFCNKN